MAIGTRTVVRLGTTVVDDPTTDLPEPLQQVLRALLTEIGDLEGRAAAVDRELSRVADTNATVARLQQVPGVGIVSAAALVSVVSHIHTFRRGRDFASRLGLTPRESTTGMRHYLGRISERGDGHLRYLLTRGARAVLLAAQRIARQRTQRLARLQQWAVTLAARRGHHKTAITSPTSWPVSSMGGVVSRGRLSLTRRRAGGGITRRHLPDELLSDA